MSINVSGHTGWLSIPNAIGRSRLPHPTVHLLVNLLTHSEGFNASYALIREQTGLAPGTISSAIKNLQKLDLMTVRKVKGKGGKFAGNEYDFHADRLWNLTPEFVEERLNGSQPTTADVAEGERATATGAEHGTATAPVVEPLQELNTKKDHLETPSKKDHSPLPPKGDDGASAAGPSESEPAVIESEIVDDADRGKGRSKDMQEFGDAYDTIAKVTPHQWPELAKVWHQMFNAGELPSQDVLLEGLRTYYRAVKHNQRVTGRMAVKRPANWLRDRMWLATEGELMFEDTASKSYSQKTREQRLSEWGAPSTRTDQPAQGNGAGPWSLADIHNNDRKELEA